MNSWPSLSVDSPGWNILLATEPLLLNLFAEVYNQISPHVVMWTFAFAREVCVTVDACSVTHSCMTLAHMHTCSQQLQVYTYKSGVAMPFRDLRQPMQNIT